MGKTRPFTGSNSLQRAAVRFHARFIESPDYGAHYFPSIKDRVGCFVLEGRRSPVYGNGRAACGCHAQMKITLYEL